MTPSITNHEIISILKALPKADLHVHLEGTVRWDILQILAKNNQVALDTPVVFTNGFRIAPIALQGQAFPALNNFEDFISLYVKIVECIQTEQDIICIALDYAQRMHEENTTEAELYFSPTTFQQLNRPLEPLFLGLAQAEQQVWNRYGRKISWIFDIVRNASENGEEIFALAEQARKLGASVNAIGLAGYEKLGPAKKFVAAFQQAKKLGYATLAHAGETLGAESISETLHLLQPDRIGHALTVMEDQTLVDTLRELQTPIEVCPWSNVLLQLTSQKQHPIKKMHDAGLNIIICSDDPGIFGKTLSDNYFFAYQQGIPLESLQNIAEKSCSRLQPEKIK